MIKNKLSGKKTTIYKKTKGDATLWDSKNGSTKYKNISFLKLLGIAYLFKLQKHKL